LAGSANKFFEVVHRTAPGGPRAGLIRTSRGDIPTPVFMPVGTQGTVKTISNDELLTAGAKIILGNTYHLYLRPGTPILEEAGGLHPFMNWKGPILTDSGGFQVFSLSSMMKVRGEGVDFKSHLDGSSHFFSPEKVVEIQRTFGSDILMPLDECLAHPAEKSAVEKSLVVTLDWARRSREAWNAAGRVDRYGAPCALFGIVQGGTYADLRRVAARQMVELDLPGYAIGGLSVGEPTAEMYESLAATVPELPEDKPRYLMGVGLPLDLFEAVGRGVDMFDCVVPTRNGRNATVFTRFGKLHLRGASHARDSRPIEEGCPCYACRNHTRAYLRHLFNAEEHLGGRLASLHNLTFFIQLLDNMRRAILENRFEEYRRAFERDYADKGAPAP
jgi:queuine tRNA-ribosyltransferase